jgi:2-keto-4-pentenoate hydratase
MPSSIDTAADQLFSDHASGRRFASIASLGDLRAAYDVQAAFVDRMCRASGARPIGYKIGLTSARMQAMCNIDQPIGGVVLSNRVHATGAPLRLADFGRLGIEFEIGVRLGRDIGPEGAPFSMDTVSDAVEAICPAMELVDDRNADYKALDVISLVADNSWNGGIVLGEFRSTWPDLEAITGTATRDGIEIDRGRGSDVLGHPLAPLVWLANHRAARGAGLKSGDIVLTGTLCPTRFPVAGERYRFDLEGLGSVEITVTG